MIFVTLGTNEARFDRLLQGIDGLAGGDELVVQHGPSPVRPAGATCVEFLPFEEMVETMRRARIVVTHAGVGSVMTALLAGKRPVVVPRLHRYGEAVDDHQLLFGRRLAEGGLAVFVDDLAELRSIVENHSSELETVLRPDRRLVLELQGYVSSRLAPPGPTRAPRP
jgi:UDP-N-acetylglucosamine transferase subunit ALG13